MSLFTYLISYCNIFKYIVCFLQADIAPLMASLIGVPFPVNSVVSREINEGNWKYFSPFYLESCQKRISCLIVIMCVCVSSGCVTSSLP